MQTPDFIIAGAPKCGTSSLYNWLDSHPNIEGSTPKETNFFLDKGHPLLRAEQNIHDRSIECYERFWPEKKKPKMLRFEASTHYLYSENALNEIVRLKPVPKIIIVLREPANRIYSSFMYSKNNLAAFKSDISFKQYIHILKNQPERLRGYLRNDYPDYILKRELEYSSYHLFVRKWKDVFGDNNVLLLFFEEMIKEEVSTLETVLNFLNVESKNLSSFVPEKRNETYVTKYKLLHILIRKLNSGIGDKIPGKRWIVNFYKKYLTEKKYTSKEDEEVLESLSKSYVKDNNKLEELINREVPWKSR